MEKEGGRNQRTGYRGGAGEATDGKGAHHHLRSDASISTDEIERRRSRLDQNARRASTRPAANDFSAAVLAAAAKLAEHKPRGAASARSIARSARRHAVPLWNVRSPRRRRAAHRAAVGRDDQSGRSVGRRTTRYIRGGRDAGRVNLFLIVLANDFAAPPRHSISVVRRVIDAAAAEERRPLRCAGLSWIARSARGGTRPGPSRWLPPPPPRREQPRGRALRRSLLDRSDSMRGRLRTRGREGGRE